MASAAARKRDRSAATPKPDKRKAFAGGLPQAYRRLSACLAVEGYNWPEIEEELKQAGATRSEALAAMRFTRDRLLPRLVGTHIDHKLRKRLRAEVARVSHLYSVCLRKGEYSTAATVAKHLCDLRGVTPKLKAYYARMEGRGEAMALEGDAREMAKLVALTQLSRLQQAASERELTVEETRQLEQCARTISIADGDGVGGEALSPIELRTRIEALAPAAQMTPMALLGDKPS